VAATIDMIPERATQYRVTPKRGAFHVEAVTADGAVDLVTMCATEDEAVRQRRELDQVVEHEALQALIIEERLRGPRGKLLAAIMTA
jgi:hypothetical protein